jgi:phage-related minor tail protein
MIDEGKASLAVLAQVADQSQNPRAYEVLAKLIDTLLDANRQLLELQTKIRTIQQADTGVTGNQTINNNLYLTTTDLHKLLKEKRDNE